MLDSTQCCGVKEYSGLTDFKKAEDVLIDIVEDGWFDNRNWDTGRRAGAGAFITFTDNKEGLKADRLISYIRRNGLGQVTKSATRKNPNSGNMVTVVVWAINNTAFLAWAKRRKLELDGGDSDLNW